MTIPRLAVVAAFIGVAAITVACAPISTTQRSASTTTSSTTSTTTGGAPSGEVGLAVVGDAGDGSATQQQVADQIVAWSATHRVDALLTAGDNVYPDGSPASYATTLDVPYAGLAPLPFWPALGNHDVQTGHGGDELAHLGITPAVPGGGYYERDVTDGAASVQILFADSNSIDAAQTTWLGDRLTSGDFDWRIVSFHHPAWSCGPHGSTATVIDQWVPILDAHADLVLQGHDHLYERFTRDTGARTLPYVVTGGGGAPLYDSGACSGTPPRAAWAKRHHFLWVDVTDTTMQVTVVARTGETLDQFDVAA